MPTLTSEIKSSLHVDLGSENTKYEKFRFMGSDVVLQVYG